MGVTESGPRLALDLSIRQKTSIPEYKFGRLFIPHVPELLLIRGGTWFKQEAHTMTSVKKIGVIMGSSRPIRLGEQITDFVMKVLAPHTGSNHYEKIDLITIGLPVFNEPNVPAYHKYTMESTKKWGDFIDSKDAIIFVTPEYNYSIPAVLKNAIDHLCIEWKYKPVLIISYGFGGGRNCAGHLKTVTTGSLKMRDTETQPQLKIAATMFDENNKFHDIDSSFAEYKDILIKAHAEFVEILNAPFEKPSE
eukprot:gene4332-5059_t